MRIEIPEDLADKIEPLLDEYGYNSATEFIKESARLRLEDFGAVDSYNGEARGEGV